MEMLNVVMRRRNMRDIPQHDLPPGFAMRPFAPGDRPTWLAVQQAAEPYVTMTDGHFQRSFGDDLASLPERSYFLTAPDGRDIGVVSAWYHKKRRWRPWGLVHYLAIVPEFHGQGLAKPVVSFTMNRLVELGHRRAMLKTQTPRIAAIKVYLHFGFVPDMKARDARRRWQMVSEQLSHPAIEADLT